MDDAIDFAQAQGFDALSKDKETPSCWKWHALFHFLFLPCWQTLCKKDNFMFFSRVIYLHSFFLMVSGSVGPLFFLTCGVPFFGRLRFSLVSVGLAGCALAQDAFKRTFASLFERLALPV